MIVGVSYAYWLFTRNQTTMNKLLVGCLTLSLSDEQNDINLQKTYPISDEEGAKLVPYSFTITNTCDLFADYTINLEVLGESTLDSKYIRVMLNNEAVQNLNEYESTTTSIANSKDSKVLAKGSLGSGDSVDYTLRLWLDGETGPYDTEAMNKTLATKIVVGAVVGSYSPVEQGYTTLADAILANEYQTTPEIAKQKINEKQEVDFSKTAPLITWQENQSTSSSTVTSTMPHPDLVGDGESYTANLTSENILPTIGTGYTFNSETGEYDLTGYDYVDPTTLDYNANNYYYCRSLFTTGANDSILVLGSTSSCLTIYKLTGATKEEGTTTGNGGTAIKTMVYRMTGYAYTQTELESDKSDKGLYPMEDDYGTSYYYRGSVTNNYVYFAGYYWRIIRINGDGSVRLLYAGETSDAEGTNLNMKLTDSSLGYVNRTNLAYNTIQSDPTYVGYMYGNTLGSSYAETIANENDSTIKKYLDSWYKQNILDKGYADYIADSGFCNDRSLSTQANNGDGVSLTGRDTNYASVDRYRETYSPILTCPNINNDLFTTSVSEMGNNALTYPIGLITADELVFAGLAAEYINKLSYTYSSSAYWTMTPSKFYGNGSYLSDVYYAPSDGLFGGNRVISNMGVRGVINLKGDVQISRGIGTANDPFVISSAS